MLIQPSYTPYYDKEIERLLRTNQIVQSYHLSTPHAKPSLTLMLKARTSILWYDHNVYPMLTTKTIVVIEEMAKIVLDYTENTFGGVKSQIEVKGFTDPEEDIDYISLVVDVPVEAQKALEFWDELGDAVDKWASTLPPDKADIVLKQISARVRWA